MNIESKKIGCQFEVSDATRLDAIAHLFEHKYAGRTFWFGVAQLNDIPKEFPADRPIRLYFEDGRVGYVSIRDGKMMRDGYFEVAFVGLDEPKSATQS